MVREFVFCTAIYDSGDWESAPRLPAAVIDGVAKFTSLPVAPKGVNVRLDSPEIFNFPFVWLTGHLPVRFSPKERENLKAYVERGGFMMIDDHNHNIDGIFHKTVTEQIESIFGKMKEVPKEHDIYHCLFEFSEGPPATTHELNGWGDQLLHKELHAVFVNNTNRIGLLYSNKDYSSEWDMHPDTKRFSTVDPTRFGINLIVYALTR